MVAGCWLPAEGRLRQLSNNRQHHEAASFCGSFHEHFNQSNKCFDWFWFFSETLVALKISARMSIYSVVFVFSWSSYLIPITLSFLRKSGVWLFLAIYFTLEAIADTIHCKMCLLFRSLCASLGDCDPDQKYSSFDCIICLFSGNFACIAPIWNLMRVSFFRFFRLSYRDAHSSSILYQEALFSLKALNEFSSTIVYLVATWGIP